jgi:site-specific recombinase XerD
MAGRGPGRGTLRPVVRHGRRVFEGDWTDASGRRHRCILGESKRDAERALSKRIRERDMERAGLVVTHGLDRPLDELVDAYMVKLRGYAKERTIHDAEVALRRIAAHLRARSVRELTKPLLAAYQIARQKDDVSHKTINTEVATLQAALNYAVKMGQLAHNPVRGLEPLPVTDDFRRRKARELTEAEIDRLLEAAVKLDRHAKGIPRAPLLASFIYTGARLSELTSVRWLDLDLASRMLRFRPEITKTKSRRKIALSPELVESLIQLRFEQTRQLLREPTRTDTIFLTPRGRPWPRNGARLRRYLEVVCAHAGIEKCDPSGVVHLHALRHTFTSRLFRSGASIKTVQALTGIKSVQLLLDVYTHVNDDDLHDAIGNLPKLRNLA